jgi:DNA-binding transcriptional ArsR family regulator
MPAPEDHSSARAPLGAAEAEALADWMAAFATTSRVRLLYALLERERTVEELADAAGMTASSASHQLRLLRQASLVVARPEGRRVHYRLHDHHVVELLVAIRHHAEHVSMQIDDPAAATPAREASRV